MNEQQKVKIVFAPGSLDEFDGTQEELDAMLAELTQRVEAGEFDRIEPISDEEAQELERLYAQQNPKPPLQ